MANCYEPGVPKKSEHEQPVGNMDVHNNVQQLGLQVPSCRLCFDLPASGVQGGQRFPVPDEGRAWFGVWSGRTQAESVPSSVCSSRMTASCRTWVERAVIDLQ